MATTTSRVGIVSAAQTLFRTALDRQQHVDLIGDAVTHALKGAAIGVGDIDFVIDSGSDVLDGRAISNSSFLGAMAGHQKEESRVEEDGLWSAIYAISKLKAGPGSIGLIVAYSKPSESNVDDYYATLCDPFYQRPVGLNQKVASGLAAREYLATYGLAEDVLVAPAATDWANALGNPWLGLDEVPDAATISAGDVIASPLRQHQISRNVDGAVAIVVATERVAHRLTPNPVWITGMGSAVDAHTLTDRTPAEFEAANAAAWMAYQRAGITDPRVFDLAELSAASIAEELMVVEALGFADKGKGWSAYNGQAGTILNPTGGALPADPIMATGLARMSGAADALRNRHSTSGRAVVHGAGGIGMQNHCVITLEV